MVGREISLLSEQRLMILPRPRASMPGTTARLTRNALLRFTSSPARIDVIQYELGPRRAQAARQRQADPLPRPRDQRPAAAQRKQGGGGRRESGVVHAACPGTKTGGGVRRDKKSGRGASSGKNEVDRPPYDNVYIFLRPCRRPVPCNPRRAADFPPGAPSSPARA